MTMYAWYYAVKNAYYWVKYHVIWLTLSTGDPELDSRLCSFKREHETPIPS